MGKGSGASTTRASMSFLDVAPGSPLVTVPDPAKNSGMQVVEPGIAAPTLGEMERIAPEIVEAAEDEVLGKYWKSTLHERETQQEQEYLSRVLPELQVLEKELEAQKALLKKLKQIQTKARRLYKDRNQAVPGTVNDEEAEYYKAKKIAAETEVMRLRQLCTQQQIHYSIRSGLIDSYEKYPIDWELSEQSEREKHREAIEDAAIRLWATQKHS
jgi:hypothetical protein